MRRKLFVSLCVAAVAACTPATPGSMPASKQTPVVRLASLEIDRAQLEPYLAALREEIETSIRVEPGVLSLYAVQSKDDPTRVRLFEMYADSAAYNAHIASAHFRKYKVGTQAMVRSLELTETTPLLLATKPTEKIRSFVHVE